jgi:hypothetical protein
MKLPFVIACLAMLSGCSTLNEKECRTANWYQIGIHDGQFGEKSDLLEKHRAACQKYAIQAQDSEYVAGREQGLKQYCDLNNAFRLGLNGSGYKGTCPNEIDLKFARYNNAALEIYTIKNQIQDVEGKIAKEERERQIGKDSLKDRRELRDLEHKRERLRNDLLVQQHKVDYLMDEVRTTTVKITP